jgi:hypothetical protein
MGTSMALSFRSMDARNESFDSKMFKVTFSIVKEFQGIFALLDWQEIRHIICIGTIFKQWIRFEYVESARFAIII